MPTKMCGFLLLEMALKKNILKMIRMPLQL